MITTLRALDPSDLAALPNPAVIFFFTPLCGTCKVARRMLDVVAAMHPGWPIYAVDANFVPHRLQMWHIQSVPALAYWRRNDEEVEVQFAFSDVDSLNKRMTNFLPH